MANLRARAFRANMTDAERCLWHLLRGRRLSGYKFRRQRPLGPFIADFASIEHRLVIEADGGQHNESDYDARRTAWLEKHGWRVLRFWNDEILQNPEGVADVIVGMIKEMEISKTTAPSPSQRSALGPSLSRSSRERG
jgi:very-short-patch-repair endonuclease